MVKVSVCRDREGCRGLWERCWPRECLFDLWEVRDCIAGHYAHRSEFYFAEEDGEIVGLLPLSWIEETERYSFFPGELWKQKTWLEQNKIVARTPSVARALVENVAGPFHLRYLSPHYGPDLLSDRECVFDEAGYLFEPRQYGYSFDCYLETFSSRSRKKLARELNPLEARGLSYRFDHFPDLERLFALNLSAFGENSYFHDPRFLRSFETLAGWLRQRDMLRITTLLLGDEAVAVDMGAVWNGQYTVLAGGTDPAYPGVAKLINFQHLRWACGERIGVVDFLCGDFGWKDRFHLRPRPLYLLDTSSPAGNDAGHANCG